MSETPPARPSELSALEELARTADESARDERLLARRIRYFRDARVKGRPWHDILAKESRPGALQLVAAVLARLTPLSGALRRSLARGLRTEGATLPEIGDRFGVSHQRVSAVLKRSDD
jgi:hypothetical protein